MNRFTDVIVPFGLRIACRRASCPTSRSPCSVNATTDGVVRDPSALGITVAWPPSMVAITEFVVPRSMPTAFGMVVPPRLGAPLSPRSRAVSTSISSASRQAVDWQDYQTVDGSRCGGGTQSGEGTRHVEALARSAYGSPGTGRRVELRHDVFHVRRNGTFGAEQGPGHLVVLPAIECRAVGGGQEA